MSSAGLVLETATSTTFFSSIKEEIERYVSVLTDIFMCEFYFPRIALLITMRCTSLVPS